MFTEAHKAKFSEGVNLPFKVLQVSFILKWYFCRMEEKGKNNLIHFHNFTKTQNFSLFLKFRIKKNYIFAAERRKVNY